MKKEGEEENENEKEEGGKNKEYKTFLEDLKLPQLCF